MLPSPSTSATKPKSALDVVVNQLVRASVGGVPSSLPDQDLDKYVADLILKEAAAKNKKFNKEGIRAYLPHTGAPPCNLPKANKRFLFNVVKSVDDHNQALIRKEEEAARKQAESHIKHSRRRSSIDNESRHRRQGYRGTNTNEFYQSDDYRRERSKGMRVNEIDRSSKNDRRNSPQYVQSDYDNDSYGQSSSERERHHKRKRGDRSPRSLSPITSSNNITNSHKRSHQSDHSHLISSSHKHYHTKEKQTLRETSKLRASSPSTSSTLVTIKGRGEVSNGSKMDKYFHRDYDPMLDVEPFLGENGWFIDYDQFEKMYQNNESHSESEAKKSKKKKKHHDRKEKSKHKKKKHHKSSSGTSKSKRKRKTCSSSDSENESSTTESSKTSDVESSKEDRKRRQKSTTVSEGKLKKSVREWDIPKLASGSWDPEQPSQIPW